MPRQRGAHLDWDYGRGRPVYKLNVLELVSDALPVEVRTILKEGQVEYYLGSINNARDSQLVKDFGHYSHRQLCGQ